MSTSNAPATVTADGLAPRGARCLACDAVVYPAREVCPGCDEGRPEPEGLPTTGTVWTFTVLHHPAPSYGGPVPYALGVVDLGEIRLMTTLLVDDPDVIVVGAPARFEPVDIDGHVVVAYRVTTP